MARPVTTPEARRDVHPADRSIRPVVQHALTVYFDGNAELAQTLIDRLLAEVQPENGSR